MSETRLVAIFTACEQTGIDTYVDRHVTRIIELTENQIELLKPPKGMSNPQVVYGEVSYET